MATLYGFQLPKRYLLPIRALLLVALAFLVGHIADPSLPPSKDAPGKQLKSRGVVPFPDSLLDNANFTAEPRALLQKRVGPDVLKSVEAIRADIRDHGEVGNGASLFYSGIASGPRRAKSWYCTYIKNLNENPFLPDTGTPSSGVSWEEILPNGYFQEERERLDGLRFGGSINGARGAVDTSQTTAKRASQAFAEETEGVVYFFTDTGNDGKNFNQDTAWGGWEFPALTRNEAVELIVQVDPDFPLRDDQNNLIPQVIWRPEDGKTTLEPRGALCAYNTAAFDLFYDTC
ncbi:hypothetical protein GQ53DRAFT_890222 [Thozetella sp. PMI_491]|nr:hypothetical protein GQ53DRAFT_890222 [Thozetella sp. PMI_491]